MSDDFAGDDPIDVTDEHEAAAEEEPFEPFYKSVDEWVTDWLLPNYSRPLRDASEFVWDPQWWRYSEVIMRLEALWASWEKMRLEGGPGMVAYFRDYLDPMMRVILDPKGPFHTYDTNKHDRDGERDLPEPLPHSPLTVPDLFRLDFD